MQGGTMQGGAQGGTMQGGTMGAARRAAPCRAARKPAECRAGAMSSGQTAGDYPLCSRTVRDRCINPSEAGTTRRTTRTSRARASR
jgi:hypothetical protein